MKKFILGLICGSVLLSTVSYASNTVQSYLFPVKFLINGVSKQPASDSPVLNYNGHAYLPIRFIAESMNSVIGYEDETKTIIIKNQALDNINPDEPNYKVRNLILLKDGENTRVLGQIDINKEAPNLAIILTFSDAKGAEIGGVGFGGLFVQGIHNFDVFGTGDFRNYVTVKVDFAAIPGFSKPLKKEE